MESTLSIFLHIAKYQFTVLLYFGKAFCVKEFVNLSPDRLWFRTSSGYLPWKQNRRDLMDFLREAYASTDENDSAEEKSTRDSDLGVLPADLRNMFSESGESLNRRFYTDVQPSISSPFHFEKSTLGQPARLCGRCILCVQLF